MEPDPLASLAALEGVASAYVAARDGIDAVLRDRGLRRTAPEATVESLLRGAHASATLAGSRSSLEDCRGGVGDPTAQAALRVSTELLGLRSQVRTAPLQVLARLHVLATGARDAAEAGRPRDDTAAERLRGVGRLFSEPTAAPVLVVAAVVHAELATAEPFGTHDGVVARAAERLVLAARGVDEKSLTVPEAGHLAAGPAYAAGLRGYRDGGVSGVQAWLLQAASAYAAGAEASPLR